MSANDPGFILFGQKMSASQIPATSSPVPSNSPPEHDWSSLKKTEAGMPSTENSEQQKNEHQKNEATKISSAEEFKMMKKPDKIQRCPRCNSMDTKFCYFNNYNVNQPQHFCKSCHRYWTAGGAMRNLPFGAGRRRNMQLSVPSHPPAGRRRNRQLSVPSHPHYFPKFPPPREKPEEVEVAVKPEINVVVKSEASGSGYDSGDESHRLPSPTSVLQFRSNYSEEIEPQKASEPEKESEAETDQRVLSGLVWEQVFWNKLTNGVAGKK